ncbi:MAG: hypothetical protein M0Q29_01535 [Thiopseudomonas sp.]|nr:hypothetical protein [Thiopseudomonas sp.]
MKQLVGALIVISGILYPFAVYYGFERVSAEYFAGLLALVWLGRALLAPAAKNYLMTAVVLLFCAVLWIFKSPDLLHWYPVIINVLLCTVFLTSLYHGPPIIERLARLQETDLPQYAVGYVRKVTQAWVVFFFCNAAMAAWLTVAAPRSWWLLYNGFIAYLLIGLMFAIEWLVRQRVKKAHELD